MKNIPSIAAAAFRLIAMFGFCASFLLATPAVALDPARRADSYSVQGWSTEQGLPSSKIRSVVETHDGYLWIATAQGMARFDGIHFTVFTRATNPELGGGGFYSVVEGPDGTVWCGGDNGLFCYRDGHFKHFTIKDGLKDDYVRILFLGGDGTVIVCTRTGFSFIRDGHITTPEGLWKQVSTGARFYLERTDGSILLGTSEKVWRISGQHIEAFAAAEGLAGEGFSSLAETSDHSIWIGHGRGLRQVHPDGRTEDYGEAQGLGSQVVALRSDRDGNLWIGTIDGGLYRLTHGRIEAAIYSEQFGTTPIRQIYEDRQGGLWIASATGLFRLKDNICATIGIAQGLARTSVSSVLETQDGSWWIGLMSGGVFRYNGLQATPVSVPTKTRFDEVTSLAESPAGTVWVGAYSGLYCYTGGTTTNFYRPDQETAWLKQIETQPGTLLPGVAHRRICSIAPDGSGGIWVATEGALYHHGCEGGFRAYTKADGLPSSIQLRSVIRSRNGDIWITAPPEGVACLHDGRWTNYLCGKSISSVLPRIVYEDSTGTIWVTTDGGGLNRFKNGHWRIFTSRDGLDDDFISGITEDSLGNLWIACPNGIMRIPYEQFDELDAGHRTMLQPRIVNQSDGLPSAEVNQQGSPNAYRTRDGRLLFTTDRGVAVIQPADLKISRLLLPMHIERFVVNGVDVNFSRPVVIPPGNNDVQIHYTAISLLAAEKVRFKIRLTPLDRDWADTGDRRDVRYAKLPPGNYTFRVSACNGDGVWNEVGVSVSFAVQPHFYQTAWFMALAVLTVGGMGFGIYRVRVVQIRRRTAQLEGLVKERTRELISAKEAAEAAVNARNEVIINLERADARLAKSLSLLNATLESTADGVLVIDRLEHVVSYNIRFVTMWGLPIEKLVPGEADWVLPLVVEKVKDSEMFLAKVRKIYSQPELEILDVIELKDGRIFERYSQPQRLDGECVGRVWCFRDITKNKQAEQALRESQTLYHSLVEQLPVGVFRKDKEGRYVFLNSWFCRLKGVKAEKFLGRTPAELAVVELAERAAHHHDVSKLAAQGSHDHDQIMRTGEQIESEEHYPDLNGKEQYLHVVKSPVMGPDRTIIGTQGIIVDISQHKQALADLAKSLSLLNATLDSTADGILVVNCEGKKILQNQRTVDLWKIPQAIAEGYDDEARVRHVMNATTNPDKFRDRVKYFYSHPDQRGEDEIELKDGTILERITAPILDKDGTNYGRIWTFRDVTLRKQAETELAYERHLLRTLLENSTDHIYFKDAQSRFIVSSNAQAHQFGVDSSDVLVGKSDFDFFTEEHARPAFEDEQKILRTGQPIIGKIEKESWKDGRGASWVLTTKMPLRDKAGEIIGTFGISKDITVIKEAEAKLEAVHRQLLETSRQAGMAEVATSVLHNVGNVLNSVNVSTTLILETLRKSKLNNLGRLAAMIREQQGNLAAFFTTDPKGVQLPDYLTRLAEHLAGEQTELLKEAELTRQHVEHIKDIVSMQQSYAKVSGVVEKVKVLDLVEDALRLNGGALVRHDVQVIRDFPGPSIEINVERQKVLQILVNLIRNAKYACDDSGRKDKRMTMQVRNGEGRVYIAVIDNGVGIPAENLMRIFNHGFTTRANGHGFGLHSGALAAKELGGTLNVESNGPGTGAKFTLELPVQPPSIV